MKRSFMVIVKEKSWEIYWRLQESWFWKFYRWFTPSWLSYVFEKRRGGNDTPWLTVIHCRVMGHPNGEVFYNLGGSEPNHHCKDCGEDIG
jgi:hypothetical protein